MATTEQILEKTLREQIPITAHMGVTVDSYHDNTLTLSAPLANNINHKSTAFGGSLYSICAVAGWALLHSKLQENSLHGHIVIHKGEITYHKPVQGDFQIVCAIEDQQTLEIALDTFRHKGRARLLLNTQVIYENQAAVDFKGSFVIHS